MIKYLTLLLLTFNLCAGGVLAPNGKPYREIVIAPDATPMVKLAANELRDYLKATTGAELPVVTESTGTPVILVGESPAAEKYGFNAGNLKPEGFRIVSRPDVLAIIGRDHKGGIISLPVNPWRNLEVYNAGLGLLAFGEAGTLYGVYDFLEKHAGVRWYMPTEFGTVIQEVETLKIPEFELADAPKVNYRYAWFCLGEKAGDQLLWLRRSRQGGTVPVYIMHSYFHFLKYKDSHPEYFALVDDKRDFDNLCAIGGHGHLCLTNPAVVEQWIKDIRAYFDANPEQRVYPLVPMDGLTRVCGCANCQKEVDNDLPKTGRFSNHIWGFLVKVANEVIKTHPDRIIGCLAYESYFDPPSRIEKLPPNAAVMICYNRANTANPHFRKKVRDGLEQWRERTSNIYTWNWYLEHWAAWKGLPIAAPQLYADEYKYLDQLKVWKGEFIEAEGHKNAVRMEYPGTQHLNLYLSVRSMWNPDFDQKQALDEYYRLFYGPAEKPMRAYWELAASSYMNHAAKSATVAPIVPEETYPPDVLDKLFGYLEEALKLAPADSQYRQRVELIKTEFEPAYRNLQQFVQQGRQHLDIPRIKQSQELDKLPLQRFVGRNGTAASPPTWFAAGHDGQNLYLKFFCFEPEMAQLKASRTERDQDGMWEDDGVEIFLSSDLTEPENCVQFIINANGAIWDARRSYGRLQAREWNAPGTKAVSKKEANRWVLEVTIPFAELDIRSVPPGMKLTGNFLRGRTSGDEQTYSCWSPLFTPVNYSPGRFGTMNLR